MAGINCIDIITAIALFIILGIIMKVFTMDMIPRFLGLYITLDCAYYLIGITCYKYIPGGDLWVFLSICTSFCGLVTGVILTTKSYEKWLTIIVIIELITCIYWSIYSILIIIRVLNDPAQSIIASTAYDLFSCSMGIIACTIWLKETYI